MKDNALNKMGGGIFYLPPQIETIKLEPANRILDGSPNGALQQMGVHSVLDEGGF